MKISDFLSEIQIEILENLISKEIYKIEHEETYLRNLQNLRDLFEKKEE